MPKLAFKPEVRLGRWNLRPEAVLILEALLATAPPMFDDVVLITSACDGQREKPSCHELGLAFDVRYLPGQHGPRPGCIVADSVEACEAEALAWSGRLAMALGRDYDILIHLKHIHIERDAR